MNVVCVNPNRGRCKGSGSIWNGKELVRCPVCDADGPPSGTLSPFVAGRPMAPSLHYIVIISIITSVNKSYVENSAGSIMATHAEVTTLYIRRDKKWLTQKHKHHGFVFA